MGRQRIRLRLDKPEDLTHHLSVAQISLVSMHDKRKHFDSLVLRIISGTVDPWISELLDSFDTIARQFTLTPKVNAALLCLSDAVHLPLTPYVVFKFSDKRQNSHHKLSGARCGV